MIIKRHKYLILTMLVISVSIGILFSYFVNTHDDYYIPFGISAEGSVQFAADIGNGRYLSNFLGNFLSQRGLLNDFIKAAIFFFIILLLADNSVGLKLSSLIIASALLIYPSKGMFGSCYVWSHCYYNYVLPIFLWLASLSMLKRDKKLFLVPLITAAFLQMLCSENTSIIIFLAAAVIACFNYKSAELCSRKTSLLYLAVSFIGLLIMFALPKLMGVSENVSFYRDSLLDNGIIALIKNAEKNIFYISCYLQEMCILYPAFLAFLLADACINKKYKYFIACFAAYIAVLILEYGLNMSVYESRWYIRILYSAVFMLFQLLLIISTIKIYSRDKKRLLIIYILALLSQAELLVVEPIGTRCLFITYILYSSALIMLIDELLENNNFLYKYICALFSAVYVICCAVMIPKMKSIYELDKLRLDLIRAQLAEGHTTINVINLPDDGLLWIPNGSYAWSSTFNLGDPDEMTFNFYPPEILDNINNTD